MMRLLDAPCRSVALILGLSLVATLSVAGRPMAPNEMLRGEGKGDTSACEGGATFDDGSAETGYGWVPSVIEGEYVLEIDSDPLSSRRLRSVCVCWLRTQSDDEIDFEVVFYHQVVDPEEEAEGHRLVPAAEPYAVVPSTARIEPQGIAESFAEVDVDGVMMPRGRSYVGARWNASSDQFFFVCGDTSPETPVIEAFFRDELAEGEWASTLDTIDPIFDDYRTLMVRLNPHEAIAVDVPALGVLPASVLALILTVAALLILARRS